MENEKVLWEGKPNRKAYLVNIIVITSIIFTICISVYIVSKHRSIGQNLSILFHPITLVFLFFLLIIIALVSLIGVPSKYSITDNSVIIYRGTKIERIELNQLLAAKLEFPFGDKIAGNNTGTITFMTTTSFKDRNGIIVEKPFSLLSIQNAKTVFSYFDSVSNKPYNKIVEQEVKNRNKKKEEEIALKDKKHHDEWISNSDEAINPK